jgi:hypothetical protein
MPINPVLNGAQNVATGQVTVATTATLIIARRATRRAVGILNTGANTVFIGAAGVTATTGHQLTPGSFVGLPTVAEVWGIGSGSSLVTFTEVFD